MSGASSFFSGFFSSAAFLTAFFLSTGALTFGTETTQTCSQALQRIFLPIADSGTRILVLHSGQAVTIVSAMGVSPSTDNRMKDGWPQGSFKLHAAELRHKPEAQAKKNLRLRFRLES